MFKLRSKTAMLFATAAVASIGLLGVAPATAAPSSSSTAVSGAPQALPDYQTFNPAACIDPRHVKRIIGNTWYAYVWMGAYDKYGCEIYRMQPIGPVR